MACCLPGVQVDPVLHGGRVLVLVQELEQAGFEAEPDEVLVEGIAEGRRGGVRAEAEVAGVLVHAHGPCSLITVRHSGLDFLGVLSQPQRCPVHGRL
eukprot:4290462-Alexandrium_andersonii.AAC.1